MCLSETKPNRILGLVTARGGSKRIPGKNILHVGGKPLIAWTIEEALQSRRISRVVVSTDAPDIASIAQEYGADVPFMRAAKFAGDASPHIHCVLNAVDVLAEKDGDVYDAVCLLQPTSPLRKVEDIDGLLAEAHSKRPPAMVSICESTEHPYLTRTLGPRGELHPLLPQDIAYPRKQDLPGVYFINGAVYYNTVESLRRDMTFCPAGTLGYEMPVERSLQIDLSYELNIADLLLRQRLECKSLQM